MVRQRVSGVVIKDKKILLVTDAEADFFYPPGGGCEQNETHEKALHRELGEELGVGIASMQPYITYKSIHEKTKVLQEERCYLIELSGKPVPQSEITEKGWYTRYEILHARIKTAGGIKEHLLPALIKDDLL